MKTAIEYFEKQYGSDHIQGCVDMNDGVSLFSLMDEFANYKAKQAIQEVLKRAAENTPQWTPCKWGDHLEKGNYLIKIEHNGFTDYQLAKIRSLYRNPRGIETTVSWTYATAYYKIPDDTDLILNTEYKDLLK